MKIKNILVISARSQHSHRINESFKYFSAKKNRSDVIVQQIEEIAKCILNYHQPGEYTRAITDEFSFYTS